MGQCDGMGELMPWRGGENTQAHINSGTQRCLPWFCFQHHLPLADKLNTTKRLGHLRLSSYVGLLEQAATGKLEA